MEKLPLTIVIPTRNEENRLPVLLETLKKQTAQAAEIIVSDAQSTDNTRAIAEQYGVRIVEGGKLSYGRNQGAKAATQPVILFFDADCELEDPTHIEKIYNEFSSKNVDFGISLLKVSRLDLPQSLLGKLTPRVIFRIWNNGLKFGHLTGIRFIGNASGLIVKKETYNATKGFIETDSMLSEDLEFILQLTNLKKKGMLLPMKVTASGRRYFSARKSALALVGISLAGLIVLFGMHRSQRLIKISKRLYGEMGGK